MAGPEGGGRTFRRPSGMTTAPHNNLTITLLNRNNYSTLRLRGAVPRSVVRPQHVHLADRAGITPATENCRRTAQPGTLVRLDGWPHDDVWPYDGQARQCSSQCRHDGTAGHIDVLA